MFCTISSMYISSRFRATNSAFRLDTVKVTCYLNELWKLIFIFEFVFDADEYEFLSQLDELPFTIYGFEDVYRYIWISRSHTMSLCRSIPLCAEETSTYRRLCLHDAKNGANVVTSEMLSADLHSFWEILSARSLSRFLEEMCRNELFIVLCLKITTWSTTWPRFIFTKLYRQYHTREHLFSLYSAIILISNLTKVLLPSNIILGHFMNEIRVYYFFCKNTSLSRGIWNARERRRYAAWFVWKKVASLCSSFCSFII